MKKALVFLLALAACDLFAQLPTVPNTNHATFRTNMNSSLANGVSLTGSYTNPSWIVSLPFSKITGLSFTPPLVNTAGTISMPAAASGQAGYLTAADWATFNGKQAALNAAGIVAMFSGCSGTQYLGADGACHLGGGGGGGAGTASALGDLAVERTSSTMLTIGSLCTFSTPCSVRVGDQVYSFTYSATIDISGSGTGAAYVYVMPDGTLTVGHNLSVSCTYCIATQVVTSVPAGAVAIWKWTATGGTWDADGGSDLRGWLGRENIVAGTNVTVVHSGNQTIISADGGGGGTGLSSYTGTINYTDLTAAALTQDVTINGSVAYKTRFDHALICETTQFAGITGPLTVSMGPDGATADMIPVFTLMVSGGHNCYHMRFSPNLAVNPFSTGTYPLKFTFTSASGNLSTLTGGVFQYELFYYVAP